MSKQSSKKGMLSMGELPTLRTLASYDRRSSLDADREPQPLLPLQESANHIVVTSPSPLPFAIQPHAHVQCGMPRYGRFSWCDQQPAGHRNC